jgi:hypothetical protein
MPVRLSLICFGRCGLERHDAASRAATAALSGPGLTRASDHIRVGTEAMSEAPTKGETREPLPAARPAVAMERPTTTQPDFAAFEAFTKKFVDATRVVGGDINRHAPVYVAVFGAGTILAAFFSHIEGSAFHFTPSEFITLVIAGLLMICLGAALIGVRVRSEAQVEVAQSEQAQELLKPRAPLVPGATITPVAPLADVSEN